MEEKSSLFIEVVRKFREMEFGYGHFKQTCTSRRDTNSCCWIYVGFCPFSLYGHVVSVSNIWNPFLKLDSCTVLPWEC